MDDSTLFEVCERNGVSLMQESVDIASKWTEENYMKLNNEKSKEMIISFDKNCNFRHTIPNIKIDAIDVEQVDHAKLLGVTISHDLSRNKHVENIVKKAGKRLYMMYQLKSILILSYPTHRIALAYIGSTTQYTMCCISRRS